jgi:hypothetical protein
MRIRDFSSKEFLAWYLVRNLFINSVTEAFSGTTFWKWVIWGGSRS